MDSLYSVTVYCLVYNHEAFVSQTLEGFVSQRTSFSFKVIVHDDASTDGSRAIIEEYAERYPHIISPILQEENQYSKGVKIFSDIVAPRIDTKYVAMCEGDDYWCDENKLQMQFDYMENHPECSFCVHNTKMIDAEGHDLKRCFNTRTEDCSYDTNSILAVGGNGLFHTSSFFYRFADRKNMPEELRLSRIGDYPLSIYLSTLGEVHYIGQVMSVCRRNTVGSWTKRTMGDYKKRKAHYEMMISYLERVDRYFNGKYHQGVSEAITKYRYDLWISTDQMLKILFNKDTRAVFKKQVAPSRRFLVVTKGIVKSILRALHLRK